MITYNALSSRENNPGYFKVKKLNFKDKNIILKLENIGLYPGETIYLKKHISQSNVVLVKINEVVYGIREKDAQNILVVGVDNDK